MLFVLSVIKKSSLKMFAMTKAAGDAVLLEHGHARQGDELELQPCPRVSKSRQD